MSFSSITVSDIKTRLESKIHGASLSKVRDIYGLMYEAAGNVLLRIDPKETKRYAIVENALYDQVYTYAVPSDMKGYTFTSLTRQVNNLPSDNITRVGTEEFSLYKEGGTVAVDSDTGVKTLEISKFLLAGSLLNDANSTTDNGTWSVGGNATNLAADSFNYISGTASLKFDISAGGTSSYIENSSMLAVDLSRLKNTGAMFVWVYIPSTTIITAVNLRWGSSASDYYNRTVTASIANNAFAVGWNLLRFDWSGSTQVGTPTDTAINYVRVTFTHTTAACPSVRVDNIIGKLGSIFEIGYHSQYLFRDSSGTWKEKPTVDTDLVNLNVESVNVFLYELTELVAVELQGEDSSFDVQYYTNKKNDKWDEYLSANKSEVQKTRHSYYPMRRVGRR